MDKQRFSSLDNALRLLDLFSIEEPEFKVNEIADRLHIANSTAHRLLKTLEDEGFIVKDFMTNNYRLGVSILSLNSTLTSQLNIIKESNDILKRLSSTFKVTAQLGARQGEYVFYINKFDYEHPAFGFEIHLERKAPLHCTSAGKILLSSTLSGQTPEILKTYGEKLIESTIINIDSLLNELKQAAVKGYVSCVNEQNEGIHSVAVPVNNSQRKMIAAMELIGTSDNFNERSMQHMIQELHRESTRLSKRLI